MPGPGTVTGSVQPSTPGTGAPIAPVPRLSEPDNNIDDVFELAEPDDLMEPLPLDDAAEEERDSTGTNITMLPRYMTEEQLTALEQLMDMGVPLFMMGNGETPLFGFFPDTIPLYGIPGIPSWALFNLLFCALGVLLALIKTIRAIVFMNKNKKRREQEYMIEDEEDDGRKRQPKNCRYPWLIAMDIIAVAGIILFLLVVDMSLLMVFVDVWTIVFLVIFSAVMIAKSFVFTRKEKKDNKEFKDVGDAALGIPQ